MNNTTIAIIIVLATAVILAIILISYYMIKRDITFCENWLKKIEELQTEYNYRTPTNILERAQLNEEQTQLNQERLDYNRQCAY